MALNFPDNPTINQVYSDVTAGFYYRWDGVVWQSYSPSSASNIKVLDDISSQFTGIAQTFALTSGGVSVIPLNAGQVVINLGGVVQDPSDDYSVNGSNIIFSSAPEIGYSFSGISLGPAIPLTDLPARSIAPDKLTIGAPAWQSNYNVGIGTTLPTSALNVIGNANITGVITATTFDGNATSAYYASIAGYSTNAVNATNATYATNSINVSSGIASVSFLNVSGITTLGITSATNLTSQQLNVSGISTLGLTLSSENRFANVAEKTNLITGNTVSIAYTSNTSNVAICTNASGNITLNVTGIPTTSSFDNHVITFSVFVLQTGTARSCTSVSLNGYNSTIRWVGGSLANAIIGVTTTNGMDLYSFTGINTVGSASTTANYYLLGGVSGGFR